MWYCIMIEDKILTEAPFSNRDELAHLIFGFMFTARITDQRAYLEINGEKLMAEAEAEASRLISEFKDQGTTDPYFIDDELYVDITNPNERR